MQYVKLGNTGVDVSRICLGCMSFGKPGSENGVFPWARDFEEAKPIFKKAIDLGINYFDTANVYQLGTSEEITGRLIKEYNLNRDEIVVATKVHFVMREGRPNGGGSSRKNIMAEIDHSVNYSATSSRASCFNDSGYYHISYYYEQLSPRLHKLME